eukprot:8088272-Pyramimonas_sp.AAC.1
MRLALPPGIGPILSCDWLSRQVSPPTLNREVADCILEWARNARGGEECLGTTGVPSDGTFRMLDSIAPYAADIGYDSFSRGWPLVVLFKYFTLQVLLFNVLS